jgi:6-pyruvoyltetrahydropterin/6-carboxytetrahydropterin synthase
MYTEQGGLVMFEISVAQDFAAAHRLFDYEGQCSNVHGHTWKVELKVRCNNLNKSGMVMDFKDVKSTLNVILSRYDHQYINDISPFDQINPTAENIAREIYLSFKDAHSDCVLQRVKVWESATSCASYWED